MCFIILHFLFYDRSAYTDYALLLVNDNTSFKTVYLCNQLNAVGHNWQFLCGKICRETLEISVHWKFLQETFKSIEVGILDMKRCSFNISKIKRARLILWLLLNWTIHILINIIPILMWLTIVTGHLTCVDFGKLFHSWKAHWRLL